MTNSPIICVFWIAIFLHCAISFGAQPQVQVQVLETSSGVRFGVAGQLPSAPAPILFIFATDLETALTSSDYAACGRILEEHKFLCVSLDLPCHGMDVRDNEPAGLDGWRARLEKGDEFVAKFTARATAVLDYLIEKRYADPNRIAASGTSRGGFMALHFAAADERVKCTVAFAPVTNLLRLREFEGMNDHPATVALSLANHAEKLAGRPIWICIGNRDDRVGTDDAIEFTRKVVAATKTESSPVQLHVMQTLGHRIHPTAHSEAAAWMLSRIEDSQP